MDVRTAPGSHWTRRALATTVASAGLCVAAGCMKPPCSATPSGHMICASSASEVGAMYARQELWSDAYSEWAQRLPANPEDAALQYNLGVAHEALGRNSEARASFEEALDLDEQEIYVEALARSMGVSGRGARHAACLEGASAGMGAWSPTYRGVVYARSGLWSKAVEAWRPSCESGGSAASCFNLGLAAERRGRSSEAIGRYKQAMALAPSEKYAAEQARVKAGNPPDCGPVVEKEPVEQEVRKKKSDDRIVDPPRSTAACDFTPGPMHEVRISTGINLRTGPSTRHALAGKAAYGTRFQEGARQGNWLCMRENGTGPEVWIREDLLEPVVDPPGEVTGSEGGSGGTTTVIVDPPRVSPPPIAQDTSDDTDATIRPSGGGSTPLKETPSPFGRILRQLRGGERVELRKVQGPFTEVETKQGEVGFVSTGDLRAD